MTPPVKIHWDSVESRHVQVGPLSGVWADLGRAAGSVDLGLKRARIDPGMRSTPVHVHDAEEEIFFVLAGEGWSWQDGRTAPVRAGHCLVHPAGGFAHTLLAGESGLDVLAFGTRARPALDRLPRAGVAWLGGTWVATGSDPHPWGREAAAGELVGEPSDGDLPGMVALGDVPEDELGRADMRFRRRALTRGRAVLTGLQHVRLPAGMMGWPPHVHAADEEMFVVLEGQGLLLLYNASRPEEPPAEHRVAAGDVVARPAGTGVAHAFRAVGEDMVYLAYGERQGHDLVYYPRSRKIAFAGLGVLTRIEPCGYWDGEGES
jgi:uncharacterized cupin superfamily protein